jgi:hypothetical protein
MKASSYCVFLCVAVFRHENFHRAHAKCNRRREGLRRTSRHFASGRVVPGLLSEDTISRNKRNDRASNRFGLRTCDFYALGAVGIQDNFV